MRRNRSYRLCGFLGASGLLTEDACNEANLEFAWSYYRTAPKARFPADRARLQKVAEAVYEQIETRQQTGALLRMLSDARGGR